MSLDNIVEKILQEAREKASSLKAEALKEKEAFIKEAEREAADLKEKILKTTREKAVKAERCALINTNLEARKELLREKQLLISQCFHKAGEALNSFSPPEYQHLIKGILSKIKEKNVTEILFSKLDKEKLTPEFLKSLSWPSSLADLPYGFALKGERIYIDCTLEKMMEMVKPELIQEVATVLFNHESP